MDIALIAAQIGLSFILPLGKTSIFGFVAIANGRSHLSPPARAADLAVSAATSTSIRCSQAVSPIETEESLKPRLIPIAKWTEPDAIEAFREICDLGTKDNVPGVA